MKRIFFVAIILFSVFLMFSCSCQKNMDVNKNKKNITERDYNQKFMLNSVFYDIGQMADGIWLNCSMYGDEGFPNFYVDSKNKELVLRKGGVKMLEIGTSTSEDVFKTLGYPDEVESNEKWIYIKNDKNIQYIISFFLKNDGILNNIAYNVCNL